MRTAVYALAGLAAASGVSAFAPQANFATRGSALRATSDARSAKVNTVHLPCACACICFVINASAIKAMSVQPARST
jgi:hypothetical protein